MGPTAGWPGSGPAPRSGPHTSPSREVGPYSKERFDGKISPERDAYSHFPLRFRYNRVTSRTTKCRAMFAVPRLYRDLGGGVEMFEWLVYSTFPDEHRARARVCG